MLILGLLLGVIGLVFAVPTTRYYILRIFTTLDQQKEQDSVPGLEITFSYGKGGFSTVSDCFFLEFIFFNNTGSEVEIYNLRISDIASPIANVTQLLRIHPFAERNISDSYHPLKFIDEEGVYNREHIFMDTGSRERAGVPLAENYTENDLRMLIDEVNSSAKIAKKTKYFNLKFSLAIGNNTPQEKVYRY